MEAAAITSTTKKTDAARKLLDWSLSEGANKLYAENFAIVALPGIQAKLENIQGDVEQMLAKNDFQWAAANRDRILAEWTKRYDGKSEAK
jgi:iron(III) transport system substrate-binding protein